MTILLKPKFLLALCASFLLIGCGKKKDEKNDGNNAPAPDQQSQPNSQNNQQENAQGSGNESQNPVAAFKPEISVEGVLHTSYYNRATSTPYFQSSTELKDLFPDISNPKTSQLCLPTIMSYELYTQLAAKPSLINKQAESWLMRPITDQVREMYRVCETDKYRGTTAPQAANCAVRSAAGTGLTSRVHVVGVDAKWKSFGYFIDAVTTEERAIEHKDIVDGVANKESMMFLIGFYESTDGINFERKGGHFISMTSTGISSTKKDELRVWIVDPANPGREKPVGNSPFNATVRKLARPATTNLDPLITNELSGSKIEAGGYKILIESSIQLFLSRE